MKLCSHNKTVPFYGLAQKAFGLALLRVHMHRGKTFFIIIYDNGMKLSQFIVLDLSFIDLMLVFIQLVFCYILDAMHFKNIHVLAHMWGTATYLKEPSKMN